MEPEIVFDSDDLNLLCQIVGIEMDQSSKSTSQDDNILMAAPKHLPPPPEIVEVRFY